MKVGSEMVRDVSQSEVEKCFAEFATRALLEEQPQHFGTIYADPPWFFGACIPTVRGTKYIQTKLEDHVIARR